MRYEILDESGNVVNTIIASEEFVQQTFPGKWRAIQEQTSISEIERASTSVRAQRNSLLSQSDWTQVADSPVDKAVWATYRQELRDITAQTGFPFEVVWPVAPT